HHGIGRDSPLTVAGPCRLRPRHRPGPASLDLRSICCVYYLLAFITSRFGLIFGGAADTRPVLQALHMRGPRNGPRTPPGRGLSFPSSGSPSAGAQKWPPALPQAAGNRRAALRLPRTLVSAHVLVFILGGRRGGWWGGR